jgi:hypothetical protein
MNTFLVLWSIGLGIILMMFGVINMSMSHDYQEHKDLQFKVGLGLLFGGLVFFLIGGLIGVLMP